MSNQQADPTQSEQNSSSQEGEPKSVKPVAFSLYTIKLREGQDADDFEKFMLEEVFPTVNANVDGDLISVNQHVLLNAGSPDEYVWMTRLEYFIHHTPLPGWLLNGVESMHDSVREKLEPFGTNTSSTILYDVADSGRRIGK